MRTNERSQVLYKQPKKKDIPLYQAFREHGIEHLFIEPIEKYTCNDKDELRTKEGEWIRQLKPTMNKAIAGRTQKEYHNDNREQILKQRKQYYDTHKESHKEYDAKEKITCECGCIVTRCCLSRHRRTTKHMELMKDK